MKGVNQMNNYGRTALVTGANSGIGFETAAQLAENGYGKVILVTRTLAKAEAAREKLIARTGKNVYELLAADLAEPASAADASDELIRRGNRIDLLILNAGMSPGSLPAHNSGGVELTFASTLVGHHVLTMRLLAAQQLSARARIVIAGSEGARDDVPGMKVAVIEAFANQNFGGDLEDAMEAIARAEAPYEFKPMNAYVTAKAYVAWWAAVLARKLPHGMVVNAVSPGSVPATNFNRNQSFSMRWVMPIMMGTVGRLFGMAGPISAAAKRYIDAGKFDDDTPGHFFASPPGKLVGPLQVQKNARFLDRVKQEAAWNVIVRLTGGADYPQEAATALAAGAAS
jgi:NAD(P)-dependent dehydrogenase (short-subunit alcohol dehydrogenase family)